MTKITIINCIIVAVCILQTAEAGFFDISSLSLLDKINKEVSSTLDNVKGVGEKIENRGKEVIDDAKNKIETTEKQLQEGKACTKMYDEGREALNKLISIFSSCITNETRSVSADVQRLTDASNNLKANLTKDFQDTLQCFKNPLTTLSCVPNVWQNVSELGPAIEESVNAAYKLTRFFPNVRMCYKTALSQSVDQTLNKLIKDAQQCVQSVFTPFI